MTIRLPLKRRVLSSRGERVDAMDFPYQERVDERFVRLSGLALIVVTVLATCSALLV